MQYILASTSPYRKELLASFGLKFQCVAPMVDEEALKDPHLSPIELARSLARAKAQSLRSQFPKAFIIGCDQLVDLGGEVLGKPGTLERAADQLMRLQDGTHHLITALHVCYGVQDLSHTDITTLEMRRLTRDQALAYATKDNTIDCAGSYKLEKAGRALFRSIQTQDSSAIVGLPLMALTDIMLECGLTPPCFEGTTK